ncbi:hypothetical protein [Microbacterium sp. APC 3901]|uniref:hypothetical protein n=1 Tax=Microbacterium sp. APC 3901 TaxID=3035192 RepID=UPI0025B59164|nr:hypothetical protein [Microbacterium sp. APC 3901]MDN3445160.1 hypothetical protein [Microbacterium sp. APC 3901]
MRRATPWLLGAALVVAAGAVTAVTPTDEDVIGPTEVHGSFGDPVESRTLIAAATEATFADEVVVPGADWSAEGNWVVVTVAASAPHTEIDAAVNLATLTIDDRVFQASERPDATLTSASLRVGVDTVGTLAFELPPDVISGEAELRLTSSYFTAELDDLITIPLDLDDLPRTPSVELDDPELSAP